MTERVSCKFLPTAPVATAQAASRTSCASCLPRTLFRGVLVPGVGASLSPSPSYSAFTMTARKLIIEGREVSGASALPFLDPHVPLPLLEERLPVIRHVIDTRLELGARQMPEELGVIVWTLEGQDDLFPTKPFCAMGSLIGLVHSRTASASFLCLSAGSSGLKPSLHRNRALLGVRAGTDGMRPSVSSDSSGVASTSSCGARVGEKEPSPSPTPCSVSVARSPSSVCPEETFLVASGGGGRDWSLGACASCHAANSSESIVGRSSRAVSASQLPVPRLTALRLPLQCTVAIVGGESSSPLSLRRSRVSAIGDICRARCGARCPSDVAFLLRLSTLASSSAESSGFSPPFRLLRCNAPAVDCGVDWGSQSLRAIKSGGSSQWGS